MRGKGEPGVNGGPAGDAKVKVTVKAHANLSRDGDDLRLILPISLSEAVKGGKVTIDLPDGAVNLKIGAGSNTGKKMRLKGKGVKGKGDLIVELVVTLTEVELAAENVANALPEGDGEALRKGLI